MQFKFSLKKLLEPLIRLFILVIGLLLFAFFYSGGYKGWLGSGVIAILCVPVVPTIYLSIEYFIATYNRTIEITHDQVIVTKKNNTPCIYNISDLNEIRLYKSASIEKGNSPTLTAERYYHAEIFKNDKSKIVITSVVDPSIEEALSRLKGINLLTKRRVFSTIYIKLI
jgi:hypothetical protein